MAGRCGDCFGTALTGPFPADVGYVSIYPRGDGSVDWRACRDPAARPAEIGSTHIGMVLNADAYRESGRALRRSRTTDGSDSPARSFIEDRWMTKTAGGDAWQSRRRRHRKGRPCRARSSPDGSRS
jgi:hypothetical protein